MVLGGRSADAELHDQPQIIPLPFLSKPAASTLRVFLWPVHFFRWPVREHHTLDNSRPRPAATSPLMRWLFAMLVDNCICFDNDGKP